MNKTFAGFGFGPIQSGLFCYEAKVSGHFERFVVAEIDDRIVRSVRQAGGRYTVNIARPDRIDPFVVEGVELLNPAAAEDRQALLAAIAEADEIATCLPSVRFYDAGDASVARLLAEGLAARTEPIPTVIYASENHNHAAELLHEALAAHAPAGTLDAVQTLNTVIGKMSGVIDDPAVIRRLGLEPMTPGADRAILIEQFNRILISRIELEGFVRGIDVFDEKPDLLPFEEAKLYGHNAIHAMLAWLADARDLSTIAQTAEHPDLMARAREAFLDESGAALIARHRDVDDPLFTPAGYMAYADDLLERMVNPNLNDLVRRVGRDPIRKLGWDDRIYGTMRLALQYDIEPKNLAVGGAAGIVFAVRNRDDVPDAPAALPASMRELNDSRIEQLLLKIWGVEESIQAAKLIDLTCRAMPIVRDLLC
jgi:mannitol-1-phosphate 5-dehydrogenase